ncbi:DNA-binding transcriptional regulator Cro [Sinobacterium caligoides]|uniref:DNA-binding transcriptional regulator Cro n=1 Tax=Sinobacterium caligoides TaxID=933926 RepID=A0A3N2E0V4_9GAMM|nr:DNA-binding transcriptional regulator Cro [Sinobacterium caligoides]
MRKKSVIAHFEGTTKASLALGISQAAVSRWGEVVPEKQALRLERITSGKLKYNPNFYTSPPKCG